MRWLLLAAVLSSAKPVHKQHHVTWADCYVVASFRSCVYHAIRPRRSRVTGFRVTCNGTAPITLRCVYFPIFKREASRPKRRPIGSGGYSTRLLVTGYSWGCGASQSTASGEWPYVGGAAAYWPQFGYGTRIAVRGLWTVKVNDTGRDVGPGRIDVFFQDCPAAIAWGSRYERVYVFR